MTYRPYFYLGEGRGLTRLSTGEVFFVDTRGHDLSVWILFGGVWETFVDNILCALIRPGDTFIDVGANMGYYTVKMANRVGPGGRVFSFEPNPRMADFLRKNVQINGWAERVTVSQSAVGAEAGVSTLTFDPSEPGGGTVGLLWFPENTTAVDIEVVSLDEAIPPDVSVDLIKIDVEGFEPNVIAGMQQVLARSPDAAIVIEVSHRDWSAFGAPAEMLEAFAGDRRMFLINKNTGAIQELHAGMVDQHMDRDFVSYVLLLPRTARHWESVKGFLEPNGSEAASSPPPAPAASPDEAAEARPPSTPASPPVSFQFRVRRRLKRMLGLT